MKNLPLTLKTTFYIFQSTILLILGIGLVALFVYAIIARGSIIPSPDVIIIPCVGIINMILTILSFKNRIVENLLNIFSLLLLGLSLIGFCLVSLVIGSMSNGNVQNEIISVLIVLTILSVLLASFVIHLSILIKHITARRFIPQVK